MKSLVYNPNYYQGYFRPENPEKYVGDITNIIYRSGLERRFMTYCDFHPTILRWSSETIIVPYYYPIDEKMHNYHIDFWIQSRIDNVEKKYLIEIKPQSSLNLPKLDENKKTLRKIKNYNYALAEFIKNKYKWQAAREYAKSRNMEFFVITDKQLEKISI